MTRPVQIALGVTGGIAAYKAAELLRLLQDRGLSVQVIMTRTAQQFVAPLTFAALSGQKVITGLFEDPAGGWGDEGAIEHIALARRIEALVVAPATANVLAKLAHGIADDFLTTVALATRAPLIVAPAMNVHMWEHPATRSNVSVLRERGVRVIEPDAGDLACGMTGPGRLAEVERVAHAVFAELHLQADLQGETLLITAGPTREPLDPVRYIGNRSSGKMGFALAEAGRRRSAQVLLVTGPTALHPPAGVETTHVETAEQMGRAVLDRLDRATIVVMAAAVADFRAAEIAEDKINRESGPPTLQLAPTRDILGEVSRRRRSDQLLAGFAAETGDPLNGALRKLQAKRLDLVVANDVTQEGAGFDVDTNIAMLILADGRHRQLPLMSKLQLAHYILDELAELRRSDGKRNCLPT